MRFLISFPDERKAYACTSYFSEQGIASLYEAADKAYSIWIVEEDDYEKARAALEKFESLAPEDQVRLERPKLPLTPTKIMPPRGGGRPELKIQLRQISLPRRARHPFTHLLLALCAFLFFWNSIQETQLIKQEGAVSAAIDMTPLQRALLFDDPSCHSVLEEVMQKYPVQSQSDLDQLSPEAKKAYAAAEKCPAWRGLMAIAIGQGSLHVPMFEKIGKGEVWRLITPIFLHRDFLHILFNMAWVVILGRMIEERAGKLRMFALVVVIGLVSNVAQYFMGGPYFLGFSGVIVGMAGFIWMRQKRSPWEGYPLSQATLLFLLLFVVAMVVLEVISFSMQLFGMRGIIGNIANTAHIVGGLVGIALGRIPLFSRTPS